VNSPRKTPSFKTWLTDAIAQLAAVPSPRLDAEIILAHTIGKPRTYIHAHPDEALTERQTEIANARIDLRVDRVPIAYIIGHKDFYGRRFTVTTATLVPRPESELMIDLLKEAYGHNASLFPEALFADDGGKALIIRLIRSIKQSLVIGGYLFIEADPEQHAALIGEARKQELAIQTQQDYQLVFRRLA
jgi:methylase of polypeptide subunit release factors